MEVDWSRAVRLRIVEFHACWAALDLGDTPLAFDLRPPGRTPGERRRLYRDALAALARRGLADAEGPIPPLAEALRLLARAPRLCDLRVTGRTWLVAVGAAAREHGVLAMQHGAAMTGELALLPVPGPRMPAALVELVGPLTPAKARPVNIPADLLDRGRLAAVDGHLWTLADRLAEFGVPTADASSLARMCTGITAAGQLGATARMDDARERRGRWVVGFHRARNGDCVQLRRPAGHGATTVTIGPATREKLLAQLTELIEDAAALT
jgi:EspG family